MISQQLLDPSDLFRTQTFYIYEAAEILRIRKNKDLMFATLQIVSPDLKDLKNG